MEGAGREAVGGPERTVAELKELYRKVALRSFDLRPDLNLPLESVPVQTHVYKWEYLPEVAGVAGDTFTMITGVDIAYQDLEADKPEGFEAGPTENPEDENVEMDPDEHLPWPDSKLVANWWTQHRSEFRDGTLYLLGRPISIDGCQQVLRVGRQRRRAAAALEFAILQPGQPLFNVAAPGFRQQQMLGIQR